MADARPCRHDRCLPPWGYALSRRLAGSAGSASWVPRPPSAVGFADYREAICDPDPSVRSLGAPECSRHCRPPAGWRAVRPQSSRPLRGVAAAPAARLRGVPRGSSAHGASQGSVPFSTSRPERSRTSPGFASPGYVPSPGFRTLLTAFPAPIPPGLFHPGSAHGVATLQSLVPFEEPLRLSTPAALLTLPSPARLATFPGRRHAQNHGSRAQVRPARPREPWCTVFRAFIPSKVRSHPAVV
jgi:hypothetical protein